MASCRADCGTTGVPELVPTPWEWRPGPRPSAGPLISEAGSWGLWLWGTGLLELVLDCRWAGLCQMTSCDAWVLAHWYVVPGPGPSGGWNQVWGSWDSGGPKAAGLLVGAAVSLPS